MPFWRRSRVPAEPGGGKEASTTYSDEELERLLVARTLRRMIVEVNGDELDRALAEDAVRAARRAAAQRGELLIDDQDYNDSDVETDVPVYLSEKRKEVLRQRRRRRDAEDGHEGYSPPQAAVPSRRVVRWAVVARAVFGLFFVALIARHFLRKPRSLARDSARQ